MVGPARPGAQAAYSILPLKCERDGARALPQQVLRPGVHLLSRPDAPSLPDNSVSKPSEPSPFLLLGLRTDLWAKGKPNYCALLSFLNSSLIYLLKNNLQQAPH